MKQGSLVCVGVGMTLGSHLSPLARSYIEQADIVFCLVSDGIVEQWVNELNNNFVSLQSFYHEGSSRLTSYDAMVDEMLRHVHLGLKVVGAFYGHPGVFAYVPHEAIRQAKNQGFYANMEPGISAEDCLYADLGIDPGEVGCTHFETSQFMFYHRVFDSSAYLVLWQVGIAGDITLSKFSTGNLYRQVLVDLLCQSYETSHQVTLYEAPTLPIHQARISHISLSQLVDAQINQQTTLVIPPSCMMKKNEKVFNQLDQLAKNTRHLQLVN